MLKVFTILLLTFASVSCGHSTSPKDTEQNSDERSIQSTSEAEVTGTFNGQRWQYVDGRAYTDTYNGKEMLSISLVPFKLVNRTSSDWVTACYFAAPENAGKHFTISLRVPNKIGQSQGGPNGFGDGILTNVQEEEYSDGKKIIGHLGQGKVSIEEIRPVKDIGFVRGHLDIEYQDADNADANGKAVGNFQVVYCGNI